ncbi:putative signal peptide protein, partial [Puccinia sorghi]
TCWIFFLLKRLPASFSVFWSIQFSNLKHSKVSLTTFLTDIENELRRQGEIQTSAAALASALSLSPQAKHKNSAGLRPQRTGFTCKTTKYSLCSGTKIENVLVIPLTKPKALEV